MANKKQTIDQSLIRDLANILNETDLTEIEVEQDELRVRVSRSSSTAVQVAAPAPVAPAPVAAPVAAGPAASEAPAKAAGNVPSPMVGTVYMQAEPGAPSFISVGDTVSEGQTLLIVEAMKTMNQIPAPRAGKISRILVEDGAAVEFGSPLVILE